MSPKTGAALALLIGLTLVASLLDAGRLSAQTRQRVERADQLPVHTYRVEASVEELVRNDAQFARLAQQLSADLRADLAAYDIQEPGILNRYFRMLVQLAIHDGRNAEAIVWLDSLRAHEPDPEMRQLGDLTIRQIAEARAADGDHRASYRERLQRAVAALPHEVARARLSALKMALEGRDPQAVVPRLLVQPDSAAKSGPLPLALAERLVAARFILDTEPFRAVAIEVLGQAVAARTVAKPSIWNARNVSLEGRAGLAPVVVGVYDSGTDISLFPGRLFTNAAETPGNGRDDDGNGFIDDVHGIGFDVNQRPITALLLPLRDEAASARYRELSQGQADGLAGIDSRAAAELRTARVTASNPAAFNEALAEYSDYAHGTHVAGIAVAGNPAARILTVLWADDNFRSKPVLQTVALAEAEARKHKDVIAYFRKHGVRAVNMSFSFSLNGYAEKIEKNLPGGSVQERTALAQQMFEIITRAWREAIESAPEILFVIGAGNDHKDDRNPLLVPAAFELPNIITVSAVDSAGDEAVFSNYGKVDVHANGVQVPSYVPGGTIMRYSGTSMAAPQVTNLAAKLLAVRPSLTTAQLRDLILRGTDERIAGSGRPMRLINPRKSFELLSAP